MPKFLLMYSPQRMPQKSRQLLTSLSYGLFSFLIAYCCISAVAGKAGLLAYQDMASQQQQIQKAIEYLQVQNQDKTHTIDDLKNNSLAAAERAATLGYIREGEMLIVLPEAWRNEDTRGDDMRLPVVMRDSTGLPDALIRLMAAITGVFAFLAIQLFHFNPRAQSVQRMSFEKQTEAP
ncbi:MAG: septum formation initiator family protein [Rectinema sp.]